MLSFSATFVKEGRDVPIRAEPDRDEARCGYREVRVPLQRLRIVGRN